MTEHESQSDAGVRFTEEQWRRMSVELGPDADRARGPLEACAEELRYFRERRLDWAAFSRTEERKRLLRIANLADDLLSEIQRSEVYGVHFASRVIGGWTSTDGEDDELPEHDIDRALEEFEHQWQCFKGTLRNLARDCRGHGSRARRSIPANVDEDRNAVWAALAEIYENTTREEASAYVGAPGSKNEGIAAGRFVRFIHAWTAAVAGEREPNPEEIRWFLRRRLPELRWWEAPAGNGEGQA